MSIELIIYACDVLCSFKTCVFFIFIIGIVTFVIVLNDAETSNDEFIPLQYIIYVLLTCIFLLILIPSKESMYLMVGSKIAKEKNITTKIMQIIDNKLDKFLKETD